MRNLYEVLRRPVITEKSAILAELGRKYVFEVALQSTKHEIRQAVEKVYSVSVQSIATCVMHGKSRRSARGRVSLPHWKKAIVTLKPGQTLDVYSV